MLTAYPAAEVRAAEEPLLASSPPGALMVHAAFAVAGAAVHALNSLGRRIPGSRVLALVGGGNNGGDALHAAAFLARRGMAATAALLTVDPHPDGAAAARAAGVRLVAARRDDEVPAADLATLAEGADIWLDGLTGIGARGGLREPLAGAVRVLAALRERAVPGPIVLAVDAPSGIGVDDGTVPGPVLRADLTVTMGTPKPGLLLPPAAALVGRLHVVDIGTAEVLRQGPPAAASLEAADVAALWPVPAPRGHKYDRGVLGVVAGSPRYPGAGVLAVAGALAAGLGMVRYRGEASVLTAVHAAHPEVVGAAGRVQAWALGSGLDPRDGPGRDLLQAGLRAALDEGLPTVLDAGALALLQPGHPAHLGMRLAPSTVLTPHAGELATLLAALGARDDGGSPPGRPEVEASPARWARWAATETGATVLLKGPATVVAPPEGPLLAQAEASPWLATAGAGDVLTGVLGALLAGRSVDVRRDPGLAASLAAAAAYTHGRAAREAAGGGPITAGDVAKGLPATVRSILTAE